MDDIRDYMPMPLKELKPRVFLVQIEDGGNEPSFLERALTALGLIESEGIESRNGRPPTLADIEKGVPKNAKGLIAIDLRDVLHPPQNERGKVITHEQHSPEIKQLFKNQTEKVVKGKKTPRKRKKRK